MKTTNNPITEKQVLTYLNYFRVQPEWLFDEYNNSPLKEKWLKSCLTKFTSFGYVYKEGLILKMELPNGNIETQKFENIVSLSEIKDLSSLTNQINKVRELEKQTQRLRAEKVSEILNTYPPEKRKQSLEIMKVGVTELAKLQHIAQGKMDIRISDFSKDSLLAITRYQKLYAEINRTIVNKQELEQETNKPTQVQSREMPSHVEAREEELTSIKNDKIKKELDR